MWKSSFAFAAFSLLLSSASLLACTHPGPPLPLEGGGSSILYPPEFFFELEMKQLAKAYPSRFKAITLNRRNNDETYPKLTSEADLSDFKAALDAGRITPPDAAAALEEHRRARDFITATTKGDSSPAPPEWASEFSLYHEGALAFRRGQLEAARKAWEALLALPEKERHYRTTWVEFMLGRLDLDEGKTSSAAGRFQAVRKSAESGFSDSLALAASSYGWEALIALNNDDPATAAGLYLQQLSSGDLGAVDSLKVVWQKADKKQAASQPLLSKIITSGILCQSAEVHQFRPETETEPDTFEWLKALETVKVDRIGEADRLGWIAYSFGRFDEAQAWLNRADPNTALSLWLKAKLDFRAGRIPQATAAMQKVLKQLPEQELETDLQAGDELLPRAVAEGDLGLLFLAGSGFKGAFRHFLEGRHWQDAAYILERVLPLTEARKLVDRDFPPDGVGRPLTQTGIQVRSLVGRRLVRAGQLERARHYLSSAERPLLDEYANALATASKKGASKTVRADAFLNAARIARKHGMELMGTELAPDFFFSGGLFEGYAIWKERLAGKYRVDPWSEENRETKPLVIRSGKWERELLKQSGVKPEKRFHYRYVAANYAWQAARLLPNDSEKTADVLNTAGSWLKNRDPEAADRFYQAIERRCRNTEIGRAAIAIRWFTAMKGPWSETLNVD